MLGLKPLLQGNQSVKMMTVSLVEKDHSADVFTKSKKEKVLTY
jgi:hypothetical protein